MSQNRFIRCPHCSMPHPAGVTSCPVTGKAIAQRKKSSPAPKPPPPAKPAVLKATHEGHPKRGLEGTLLDGRYLLKELIGQGGMGAVYAGEHKLLRRKVAVKVLLQSMLGTAARQRFEREARVAGSLGHPNIVKVFDLGSMDDGSPFLVMEHLEGESLADRLDAQGAQPIATVARVMAQVLDGLAAAHRKGIVHRDLKPDNIFLARTEQGETAKLLDFGVSKSLDENTLALTRTGVVIGTPYYLSPEQARGDRDIDHRVDIWAAGVVLYEVLTGLLPFEAHNYNALMVKILSEDVAPPSKVRPNIPPALDALVTGALRRKRDERFANAEQMLDVLRELNRAGDLSRTAPPGTRQASGDVDTGAATTPRWMSPSPPSDIDIDIDIDTGLSELMDDDNTLISTEMHVPADLIGPQTTERHVLDDATQISDSFVFEELRESMESGPIMTRSGEEDIDDPTEVSDSFVRDGLRLPKSSDKK